MHSLEVLEWRGTKPPNRRNPGLNAFSNCSIAKLRIARCEYRLWINLRIRTAPGCRQHRERRTVFWIHCPVFLTVGPVITWYKSLIRHWRSYVTVVFSSVRQFNGFRCQIFVSNHGQEMTDAIQPRMSFDVSVDNIPPVSYTHLTLPTKRIV